MMAERKHSKFSASGADRWFNCPGSVELSEGIVDKPSIWAEEGTKAHEVLEGLLSAIINGKPDKIIYPNGTLLGMLRHAENAANFIWSLGVETKSEILSEARVFLDFINEEAFGTLDAAVVEHFGTLHVFDYKYGAGKAVSPDENLQMLFYAIALAHKYDWNFKRVRLWIIQPRIKGYDGPVFWELTIPELKKYADDFRKAIQNVIDNPDEYVEGSWCHWCKAKKICPLKQEKKLNEAMQYFKPIDS